MLKFKRLNNKRLTKNDREDSVLLGIVDLYIKTAKPIGSNTLRDNGFDFLSSATIRNYCSKLEKLGFLKQQHSSGGRVPTTKGFRSYANSCMQDLKINHTIENKSPAPL